MAEATHLCVKDPKPANCRRGFSSKGERVDTLNHCYCPRGAGRRRHGSCSCHREPGCASPSVCQGCACTGYALPSPRPQEAQDHLPSPIASLFAHLGHRPPAPVLGSGSPGTPTLHCLQAAPLLRPGHPSTARCHAHRRPRSLPGVRGSGVLVSWIDPPHLCQLVPCMGGWVLLDTFSAPVLSLTSLRGDMGAGSGLAWERPCAGSLHGWCRVTWGLGSEPAEGTERDPVSPMAMGVQSAPGQRLFPRNTGKWFL